MSTIFEWLAIGDLTSDGQAYEVAALVNENIRLLPDLVDALTNLSEAVRGHEAGALEKVARQYPEAVAGHLPALLHTTKNDPALMYVGTWQ